jgi:CRISPR-associated endonuclease/helicase Cas3
VIDLPTGMGKTMVMAIWLIARAEHPQKIPTRLIYVVDRRTVVDQATDLAQMLVQRPLTKWMHDAFAGAPPAISTLRGQLADNREWSRDPSRPAIIIGTVDLIGSALLFSGYRSSFKRRPLEAGLLGQDSLLVLDEAHLSKPFDKLLGGIDDFNSRGKGISPARPLKVIRMSATAGDSTGTKPFTLQTDDAGNLAGEDANSTTIADRFGAKKTLSIVLSEKPIEEIATAADKLAKDKPGSRIVIFARTPKQVEDVRKALIKKDKDHTTRIAQLTGTMRGLERDELVDTEKPLGESGRERRVMQRFLKPHNDSSQGSCFLISTSAGEVGFDLNADHMVCDATTIDSLIQRLGRVNRRGYGDARIVLVRPKELTEKNEKLKIAIANALDMLQGTNLNQCPLDVGPKNIAALKSDEWKDQYKDACTPEPTTVPLTDILLDNWSMTSITEPMPGRPPVDPWLRGIAEWEPPRTQVAWRAELDLEGFADLELADVEEWFDTHRILTHETLSEKTSEVAEWFTDRRKAISDSDWEALAKYPVIIDRAGLEVPSLGEVIRRLSRSGSDADAFLRGAEIIVPASFGGIRRGVGLLDPTEPKLDKDEEKRLPADREDILKQRQASIDVADIRGRYREKVVRPEVGEPEPTPLEPASHKPEKYARFPIELESDDDRTVRLVSYVPRVEKPETGSMPQTLRQHVCAVRKAVDNILRRLSLPEEIKQAAQLAADWHDHGKARERWQRLLVFPKNFLKPDESMAKSGGEMKRDSRGYRHEFGSLREFTDAYAPSAGGEGRGEGLSEAVFDLAMHLIAVHHGRGRPHFPKGGFDPDCEFRSDEIHTDAIRRFAQLQRKYGWWGLAWLENLLRCADALASAGGEATGIDEPQGGEQ